MCKRFMDNCSWIKPGEGQPQEELLEKKWHTFGLERDRGHAAPESIN